ncbi:MAG: hypothetical protein QOG52_1949 [Frankiaceae bacterium]|nr:hypothetical protein [Frankiaceae bacterium]
MTDVEPQALEARYVDTTDLRLARQGVTLRYRTGEGNDGWDLKVPLGPRDDGVRDELHVAGPPGEPPAQLLRVVSAYLRGDPVGHVAALRTSRSLQRLLDADGNVLAELVDDTVEVVDGDVVTARFREIEVEDKGGGPAVLAAMGKRLRAAGAVQGRFEPKLVRALGPLATAPADPPPPPERMTGKVTVREVVTAYLRIHVRALLDADVARRLDRPEAVHEARVAARRLRSTVRTFSSVLVPETTEALAEELAWFAGELGSERDTEVLLERLRASLPELPEQHRAAAAGYLDRWAAEKAPAAGGPDVLDSPRYAALVCELVSLATAPPFTGPADASATKALPAALRPVVDTFRNRMRKATATGSVEEDYHRARIAGKRLRYAAETTAPVYGKAARRYADSVALLQDELGSYHDGTVAIATLLARAEAKRVPAADAFVLALLYTAQLHALEAQCVRLHDKWFKVQDRIRLTRLTDGE